MESNGVGTCSYCYRFDECPSPGPGDNVMLTVELRSWKLNQSVEDHNHEASVVALGQRECSINLRDVRMGAYRAIFVLREYLTLLGVPEACHVKMIANLIQYIDMKFICSCNAVVHSRMIVMNIVEAWDMVDDLVIENAVRRSVGTEILSGRPFPTWWEKVEIGSVQRPVRIGPVEFVNEVISSRKSKRSVKRTREMVRRRELIMWAEAMYTRMMRRVQNDMGRFVRESAAYMTRMVPASELAIASLEMVVEGDQVGVGASCVICNDEEERQGFSRMPCTHVFHTKCVEKWLRICSSCPLCRYVLS